MPSCACTTPGGAAGVRLGVLVRIGRRRASCQAAPGQSATSRLLANASNESPAMRQVCSWLWVHKSFALTSPVAAWLCWGRLSRASDTLRHSACRCMQGFNTRKELNVNWTSVIYSVIYSVLT